MRQFRTYQEFYSQGPYAPYLIEHSLVGTTTVRLLHIQQPAGEFPDPPLPEYFLYIALKGARELSFDWGCGRWCGEWHPADISIAPPDTATNISIGGEHAFLGLAIPKALVELALKDLVSNTASDLGPLHASTFRDPAIVRWIHHLWRHATLGGAHCRLGTDSLLFGMLAGIARKLNGKGCQERGLDEGLAKRIRDYVEDHLSDNMSLVELATICGLSPMHFARQFKLRTGISPYQYVLLRRLARTKMLLAATDHSLAEIAYETGFSSQAHMSATFTSRIGQPPGRYRLNSAC